MFEGGYRVPCVMRWPGKIPAGTQCDELAATIDMFPTVARLIGADSADRTRHRRQRHLAADGRRPDAISPHEAFYCYYDRELRAVRDRRWKLFFPHATDSSTASRADATARRPHTISNEVGHWLFDLKNDVGETTDVAAEHPDIVARLEQARRKGPRRARATR